MDHDTGMQNPIFRIMQSSSQKQNSNIFEQNPIKEENENSFGQQMNIQNQMGMQGMAPINMNIPMMNQFGNQNNFNGLMMSPKFIIDEHFYMSQIFMKNPKLQSIYNCINSKIELKKLKIQTENNSNKKILINYYGNIFKIGIDSRLYASKIINYIFDEIFGEIHEKLIWERTDKSQTTKDVIHNPKIEYIKIRENDYSNYLYLGYKDGNLLDLGNIPCKDLDLIYLRFKKEELKNFEKDSGNNMENNINQNLDQINENNMLNIEFIVNTEKRIIIKISRNELISTLIDIFLQKIGEPLEIKNKLNFFYNDGLINMNTTVGIFFSAINPKITVKDPYNVIGVGVSPNIGFVDITSGKSKNLKVNNNGKKWRQVCKGLNIFGICEYKKCEVKGKEVIYKTVLEDGEFLHFNLNKEREEGNIICPMCKKPFKPKTYGFWRCEYQFEGKEFDYENGGIKEYNSEIFETYQNEFHYSPLEIGTKEWKEFNIYVLETQKIKYKN